MASHGSEISANCAHAVDSRRVSLSEAAELTGRSVVAIRRLADRGRLPFTKAANGHRMVAVEDLVPLGLKVDRAEAERAGDVDAALERVERLAATLAAGLAELRREIAKERRG